MTIQEYYKTLAKNYNPDTDTEHTHRLVLQGLLNAYCPDEAIIVKHEPKRDSKGLGSPDYLIQKNETTIGIVENKKVGEDLNKILKTKQIEKYKKISHNIILTNYIDWVWLYNGDIKTSVSLASLLMLQSKGKKLSEENINELDSMLKSFFAVEPPQIGDVKELASALAQRTRIVKEELQTIMHEYYEEGKLNDTAIGGLYEIFKEHLFNEIEIGEFCDNFAQMLTYSLFLAKLDADTKKINLRNPDEFIPNTFPLIREMVNFLKNLQDSEYKSLDWILDQILGIINHIDIETVYQSLSFQTKNGEADPYFYFYEDFLGKYDPARRKSAGVYYTPPAVVRFITRAIDDVLTKDFGISAGLADRERINLLDFATGTGTFLFEVVERILASASISSGNRDDIIREHILKNLYGFEFMIASYVVAHMKLSQKLKNVGYSFNDNERMQIYLTNTLEPTSRQTKILGFPKLTAEITNAAEIKESPILVITGNPPYNVKSKNKGKWIIDLLESYKKGLNERNINPLSDDYIKFIRFAQYKIENEEQGIVGVITNNSYLSGIIHRQMRKSLLESFDSIYIVDLHGNSNIGETALEGAKDENVFDIKQGVSIAIFVKYRKSKKLAKVYHSDLYGLRKDKYNTLNQITINSIDWKELPLETPYYFFVPKDFSARNQYEKGWSVKDIFFNYNSGIETQNDKVLIAFSEDGLKHLVEGYYNDTYNKGLVKEIYYRPFDKRLVYYDGAKVGRDRINTMKHMLRGEDMKSNLGLVVPRLCKGNRGFEHGIISNNIIDRSLGDAYSGAGTYLFPLYRHETKEEWEERTGDLLIEDQQKQEPYQAKRENFSKEFREYIKKLYGKDYSPEQVLGYIYAVLHNPSYRKKYAELLKIDFPRIPFTDDIIEFERLSNIGIDLIQVHLMKVEPFLNKQYPGLGSYEIDESVNKDEIEAHLVKKIHYDHKRERLYINKSYYFDKVPPEVWSFYIGGYQVIDKYLKSRKGRKLSLEERETISHIVKILSYTIEAMEQI